MSETPEVRPVDRYEWERTIRRARLGGVIAGNAKGSRGGVSAAAFKAVAFTWSSHANADGSEIYPGDATLAVESEVGLKAVKAIKAAMIRLGLSARTKTGARRHGQGDTYRLTLPVSPSLDELIEVLSPDGVRAAAVATYEKQRGVQKGSGGPPTALEVDPPVRGPVDPRQTEQGGSQRGSDGTTESGCRGSDGTVVGGPLDRDTRPLPDPKKAPTTSALDSEPVSGTPSTPSPNEPQPVAGADDDTNTESQSLPAAVTEPANTAAAPNVGPAAYQPGASRAARRNGRNAAPKARQPALLAKPRRMPEAVEIVYDNLRVNGHPDITEADAQAVHRAVVRQYGIKVTPKYLRTMADNTGFAGYYADLKAARSETVAKQLTALRGTEPECEHGTAAGLTPHPTTGCLLCPQCRAGHPATPNTAPGTAPEVAATLDAYRQAYTATHQRAPHAELLVALTQQAAGLHAHGAASQDLAQLARRAGAAGIGLLAAATQGGTTP